MLYDWGAWIGNDRHEIRAMCGYGKGISQILVDRARHDDPDTVYHKSRTDNLDQEAMKRLDYIITRKLPRVQRLVIQAEYHRRYRYRKQAAKFVGISRKWYRIQHDRAIDNISDWFGNVLLA